MSLPPSQPGDLVAIPELARRLAVGDIVFVRIPFRPFVEVAVATGTWTNHVGVVVATGNDPLIAESRFPLSGSAHSRNSFGAPRRAV